MRLKKLPRQRQFHGRVMAETPAAGQAGLVRVLEILKSEIVTTMGLLGITRLDRLTTAYVEKVQPLAPTHEMSAFPHMPGGQLL